MSETSKAIVHRLHDARYATRYLVGDGIDIGSGADPLAQYAELFPLMRSCRSWDLADGDAERLDSVPDSSFDFVHSSHCLEHLRDPRAGLDNWLRVLRPGGHLLCIVPDEDLYEQGIFPSRFNPDHKHTFTIFKPSSWSERSINVADLIRELGRPAAVKKIELLDSGYRYAISEETFGAFDQTSTWIGQSAIEFILQRL